MRRRPQAERRAGWSSSSLERHSNRRSSAITVLTALKEHVRKLGVDKAISAMSGRYEPPAFRPDTLAGEPIRQE